MKKLLVYMKEYMKECILGPLFKLTEALLELFTPLVIAAVIDKGIAMNDKQVTMKLCLLLVGLGFGGLAFSVTAQYFSAKAAVRFTARLRHVLFEHINRLSYKELDELGTSTLITRMTGDMNQVQSGVNLTLRLLLRSPFVVFGAMIMAFTIDVKSAMSFVYVTVILFIAVFAIMLASIPLYKKVQQKMDSLTCVTRENLSGARVIRAFCMEERETERFGEKNSSLTAAQKTAGKISALQSPLTYVILNLAVIYLIHTGALRVESGVITQGEVVALYNYMSQILVELIKLANLIINITKSIACGNRIQAILETEPSVRGGLAMTFTDEETAVEFSKVSLRYSETGENALSNISFTVKRGETVGIIGGTGSGKTSLVNMIPRLYKATEGEIRIGGVKVEDIAEEKLRSIVGVVPQKAVLFKGTIRDNMKWGNEFASDESIMAALTAAQAAGVAEDKGGLDFMIEQGGRNLSGGQKQRFTIARALLKRPRILILDDSASALDFATDAALRKSLRELDFYPTVFIVSQRASSIQHADKIIVLDDGEIAGIGNHNTLIQSCGVYKEICSSQLRREAH